MHTSSVMHNHHSMFTNAFNFKHFCNCKYSAKKDYLILCHFENATMFIHQRVFFAAVYTLEKKMTNFAKGLKLMSIKDVSCCSFHRLIAPPSPLLEVTSLLCHYISNSLDICRKKYTRTNFSTKCFVLLIN